MYLLRLLTVIAAIAGLSACEGRNGFGIESNTNAGSFNTPAAAPDTPAYFQQVVGDRAFFAVDQYRLDPQAKPILAAQARWLNDNPDYRAVIEGHADERGTRAYNIALGDRRAQAVKAFLIDRGVAANRLRTVSFGKERPVAICSAESCYGQNRRAVTLLASGLTG